MKNNNIFKLIMVFALALVFCFTIVGCEIDVNSMLGLPSSQEKSSTSSNSVTQSEFFNVTDLLNFYYKGKIFNEIERYKRYGFSNGCIFNVGDGINYSENDHSFDFYCSMQIKNQGETDNGKIVFYSPFGGTLKLYLSANLIDSSVYTKASILIKSPNGNLSQSINFATNGEINVISIDVPLSGSYELSAYIPNTIIDFWAFKYLPNQVVSTNENSSITYSESSSVELYPSSSNQEKPHNSSLLIRTINFSNYKNKFANDYAFKRTTVEFALINEYATYNLTEPITYEEENLTFDACVTIQSLGSFSQSSINFSTAYPSKVEVYVKGISKGHLCIFDNNDHKVTESKSFDTKLTKLTFNVNEKGSFSISQTANNPILNSQIYQIVVTEYKEGQTSASKVSSVSASTNLYQSATTIISQSSSSTSADSFYKTKNFYDFSLDATILGNNYTLYEPMKCGMFTLNEQVKFKTSSGKSYVDENTNESTKFYGYVQLGKNGTANKKSISFTANKPGVLVIYSTLGSTGVYETYISLSTNNYIVSTTQLINSSKIDRYEIEISSAGNYFIFENAGLSSINIWAIDFIENAN